MLVSQSSLSSSDSPMALHFVGHPVLPSGEHNRNIFKNVKDMCYHLVNMSVHRILKTGETSQVKMYEIVSLLTAAKIQWSLYDIDGQQFNHNGYG